MKRVAELIPFNPTQIRELKLSDLAEQIVLQSKKRSVHFQEKWMLKQKFKIMRKLYHIGYGNSPYHTFPFYLHELTDKKGKQEKRGRVVDVLKAYEDIEKDLRSQGFEVIVRMYKCPWQGIKCEWSMYTEIEIKGVINK